jgi:hypothetical protein
MYVSPIRWEAVTFSRKTRNASVTVLVTTKSKEPFMEQSQMNSTTPGGLEL